MQVTAGDLLFSTDSCINLVQLFLSVDITCGKVNDNSLDELRHLGRA